MLLHFTFLGFHSEVAKMNFKAIVESTSFSGSWFLPGRSPDSGAREGSPILPVSHGIGDFGHSRRKWQRLDIVV